MTATLDAALGDVGELDGYGRAHLAPVADEAAVLGACLVAPRNVDAVLPLIPTPGIFCDARHGYVWAAIVACWERGETPDALNVRGELLATGLIPGQITPTYPAELHGAAPSGAVADPVPYLERVLDGFEKRAGDVALAQGRRLIGIGDGGDAGTILDAVVAGIQTARDLRRRHAAFWRVGDLVDGILEGARAPEFEEDGRGVPWPYRDLGGRQGPLNPMMPGQVWTVGGRPGDGKSTFLRNTCEHVSFHLGWQSLLVSWEMKAPEIGACIVSNQARVLLSHLTKPGLLTDADVARVAEYRAALDASPLTIIDDADTSIAGLDRAIREHRPRIVALDYLQKAVPDEGRPEHRRVEVERYMRAVTILAGRREIPIIVGSQLNRDSVRAGRARLPRMEDLRETGGIEQDSHGVILMHRPDLHDPDSERVGEVDFIIAKQRNGPTDTVTGTALLHYAAFADMA